MNQYAGYLPEFYSPMLELNRGFLIASFVFYSYQAFLNIQMYTVYKREHADRKAAANRSFFGFFAGVFCLTEWTSLYTNSDTYSDINYICIYLASMLAIYFYCQSMRDYYYGGEKIRKVVSWLLILTGAYSIASFSYQFFIDPTYPFFKWEQAPGLDSPLLAVAYHFRRPQFTPQFAGMNLGFMASFLTLIGAMVMGYFKGIYRDRVIFWGVILSITTVFYEVFFSTFFLEYFMTIIYMGYFPELTRTTLLAQKKLYTELMLEKEKNLKLMALKQEQIQKSKLNTLYNFSRSIAHEVNNPLAAITLNSDLLIRLGKNDRIGTTAGKIKDSVKRINKIVHILRVISYETDQDKKVLLAPADMVESVIAVIQNKIVTSSISLDLEISEGFRNIVVEGNASQISSSIYEILLNAIEATEKVSERWMRVECELDGITAIIRITNSGKLVAPENKSKLFEPFFTTKPLGEGLGLNLAKARSIFLEHGGNIIYEENDGAASFVLSLPIGTGEGRADNSPLYE